jgi:hypothetical protein
VAESIAGPTDHAGLAVLSFAECLQLAGSQPVGRVAFLRDGDIGLAAAPDPSRSRAPSDRQEVAPCSRWSSRSPRRTSAPGFVTDRA